MCLHGNIVVDESIADDCSFVPHPFVTFSEGKVRL
jgi:hypothetical protein